MYITDLYTKSTDIFNNKKKRNETSILNFVKVDHSNMQYCNDDDDHIEWMRINVLCTTSSSYHHHHNYIVNIRWLLLLLLLLNKIRILKNSFSQSNTNLVYQWIIKKLSLCENWKVFFASSSSISSVCEIGLFFFNKKFS